MGLQEVGLELVSQANGEDEEVRGAGCEVREDEEVRGALLT